MCLCIVCVLCVCLSVGGECERERGERGWGAYLVGGSVEGRGVRLEKRLSAVPVVYVDVHHGHSLRAVHSLFV